MLKKTPTPRHDFVKGLSFHGFHRVHYTVWDQNPRKADKDKNTLLCVHGVSRNGRDFDHLGKIMSEDYRVVCPDLVGRGESDHLLSKEGYDYLQYNADMNALLARLHVNKVDWVGVSLGGIIGMFFAGLPQSPIRKLVVVDVGPTIARDSLVKIGEYIGRAPEFDTKEEVASYLRDIYSEFYPLTDEDMKHMIKHASKRTKQGKYLLKMDPAVGDAFRDSITLYDVDMWDIWDKISCPVLILRGENSSFFDRKTAKEMQTRGPKSTFVEVPHAGHTPTLRNNEQVKIIQEWLAQD